jgi:non-homologous end joining protein Ku
MPLTLTFGLVSVPVKKQKATEAKTSNVNMCPGLPGHDPHDPIPVTAPKTCQHCGPVGYEDYASLVKGVKNGNSYDVVTQEDVAEVKDKFTKDYKGVINLIPHPAHEFLEQTGQGEQINYLTPDKGGEAHYALMAKLIESHPELAFVALHTPTSATSLFVVRAHNGVLVMEQRTRTQDLKPAPVVAGEVNEQLYAMLESFLPTQVTAYDPSAYEDKYATALKALAAASSVAVSVRGEAATPATPIQSDDDLMAKFAALKAAS